MEEYLFHDVGSLDEPETLLHRTNHTLIFDRMRWILKSDVTRPQVTPAIVPVLKQHLGITPATLPIVGRYLKTDFVS